MGRLQNISILFPYTSIYFRRFSLWTTPTYMCIILFEISTIRLINFKEVTISLCLSGLSCVLVACPVQSIHERQNDVQVLPSSGSIKGQGHKIEWDSWRMRTVERKLRSVEYDQLAAGEYPMRRLVFHERLKNRGLNCSWRELEQSYCNAIDSKDCWIQQWFAWKLLLTHARWFQL